MGLFKKKSDPAATPAPAESAPPTLARRSAHKHSTIKSGRTIGEQRERLETANERLAARQKDKRRQRWRVAIVSAGFILLALAGGIVYFEFFYEDGEPQPTTVEEITYTPTVEVIDEDATATSGITSRMSEYIGQAEVDYRSLGYTPVKAVIPSGAIREVDFYLDGHPGYIKMHIDRPTAVSVEDADRMLRYLADQGTTEFQYIDVRIPYKAYWK